jgi:hypothetical protein
MLRRVMYPGIVPLLEGIVKNLSSYVSLKEKQILELGNGVVDGIDFLSLEVLFIRSWFTGSPAVACSPGKVLVNDDIPKRQICIPSIEIGAVPGELSGF